MKLTPEMQKKKMEAFTAACRERGISVTAQRLAIFNELSSTDSHPNAEEMYGHLRKNFPAMSLATVYKTLDTLERHHFVTKTRATGEKARYDANTKPHHHLICRSCGRIQDLYDSRLDKHFRLKRPVANFEVTDYRVDFQGICGDCRGQQFKNNQQQTKEAVK